MNKPSIRIEFNDGQQSQLDLWVKIPIEFSEGPLNEGELELLIDQMKSLGRGCKHVIYTKVIDDQVYVTEAYTLQRLQHRPSTSRVP